MPPTIESFKLFTQATAYRKGGSSGYAASSGKV